MKIISLQAENIKRLVAIEIRPDGALVEITGENGQGKTSVLDAIWWALAGQSNIQAEPIRQGEDKAKVRLDLGEIVVTRTFKKNKEGETTSQLKVESAEGVEFKSQQTMLDKLLSGLAFDPLGFSRMTPKEQFEQLKVFVKDFDFKQAELDNQKDYDERTALNRRAKEARTVEANFSSAPLEEPEKPDTKALMTQLADASTINTKIQAEKNARDQIQRRNVDEAFEKLNAKVGAAEKAFMEAKTTQERIAKEAEEELKTIDAEKKRLAEMPPLGELVDVSVVKTKLDEASAKVTRWELWEKRKEAREKAEQLEKQSKVLSDAMDKRAADKEKAVASSELPVEGLGLGDGIVLLKGVPFEQASDAERLMTSVAIAMASNPKLKVIRIRDGSLLDTKAMTLLSKIAEEKGYQVWIERVDGSGKVGFVIEDGRLKETVKE